MYEIFFISTARIKLKINDKLDLEANLQIYPYLDVQYMISNYRCSLVHLVFQNYIVLAILKSKHWNLSSCYELRYYGALE